MIFNNKFSNNLMQLSSPHQLTDCISAKQLLQALTTLQQMSTDVNNEVELSFSQESHSFFNTANNQSKMDFQFYMALKNQNKKGTQVQKKLKKNDLKQENSYKKNLHKVNTSKIQQKRSILQKQKKIQKSALNQRTNRSNKKQVTSFSKQKASSIQKFKSKSHSPLQKREKIQKTHPQPHLVSSHLCKQKKDKQNQQNIPRTHQSNISSVKISEASKKIMIQRQRKGKTYVPIQDRTNQLIKEKQQKIAKLQRANLALKQFQQRECTFKPCINSYKKFTKNQSNLVSNRHRAHTNVDSVTDENHSIIIQKQIREKEKDNSEQSIEKMPKKDENNEEGMNKNKVNYAWGANNKKEQPKNEKFNILLDLIN